LNSQISNQISKKVHIEIKTMTTTGSVFDYRDGDHVDANKFHFPDSFGIIPCVHGEDSDSDEIDFAKLYTSLMFQPPLGNLAGDYGRDENYNAPKPLTKREKLKLQAQSEDFEVSQKAIQKLVKMRIDKRRRQKNIRNNKKERK
jgi:hypothetical protein